MDVNVAGEAALIALVSGKPAARNALLVGAKTVNIRPRKEPPRHLCCQRLLLLQQLQGG